MTNQPAAKIFPADDRRCDETSSFRSYHTFNAAAYFSEYKRPFGNLYELNDETIAGNCSTRFAVAVSSYVILLPVVGLLHYRVNDDTISAVNTGQLKIFEAHGGTEIELLNCYEDELINFIVVLIKVPVAGTDHINQLFDFKPDKNINGFIKMASPKASHPVVSIGKFTERQEVAYKLVDSRNNLFVFNIEGAFEVQGRLLLARDGLGLCNEPGIELEALSNKAIVFIVEMVAT